MTFSFLSYDPPPVYIEDDPAPDYTEEPTPTPVFERLEPAVTPAFRRLDNDVEDNPLPRPVRAPPRTYIPTHAPSITVTQTRYGPSITLTDLTRPRHQQTEEEDFGAPSTSRRRRATKRGCLSGAQCICAFLIVMVILAFIISMIVLSATNRKGDQRVGSHGCELIMDGVCEGLLDWSNPRTWGLDG